MKFIASYPARAAAVVFGLLLVLLVAAVAADVAVPPLRERVTDLTGTLQPDQRTALERELADFEARKGSQIAVLIVPSTQPETIEQYGIRVAEAWKLGRKGVDDGLLVLVALDDHALRIEVGYGLEGVVPDAVANRVIDEIMVPFFKRGDYYGGIEAGVSRLMRVIDGEPLPPPRKRDPGWSGIEQAIPFAFIAIFVIGAMLRNLLGRLFGGIGAGAIGTGITWLAVGSFLVAALVGVLALVFTLLGGLGRPGRRGGFTGGYGGWGGGGGFGGGSGGGFGGGGGGFGGGGASGRW